MNDLIADMGHTSVVLDIRLQVELGRIYNQ